MAQKLTLATLVATPDRRLIKTNKRQFVEWIYDEKTQQGWFCLRRLFTANKYFKGKTGLVIDSGYAIPLNPYSDYGVAELKELTNLDKRAEQAMMIAEGEAEKENRQNIIARSIVFGISGLVIVVIVLAILVASRRM